MPSPNQNRHSDSDYDSVYERALHPEADLDAMPILRGIRNEGTALRAHKAAHAVDARSKYKEHIAELLRQYRD